MPGPDQAVNAHFSILDLLRRLQPTEVDGAVCAKPLASCLEDVSALHLGIHDTSPLLVVGATATGFGIPFPGPSIDMHDTDATIIGSTIRGYGPQAAVGIANGTLLVADSSLTGGPGYGTTAPGAAIRGRGARVALTHSTLVGGTGSPRVAVELDADRTLAVDPSVLFAGATPVFEKRLLAHLIGAGVAPGLPASVQLLAPPQTSAFLVVADAAIAPASSPFGDLWLDPTRFFASVMKGLTDARGRMTFSYTMPPLVTGTPLYFQGLVLPVSAPPGLTVPLAVAVQS